MTASETLYDIVKTAARATLLLTGIAIGASQTGCISLINPEKATQEEVEQSIDGLVTNAIKKFKKGETAKAQGLLEDRKKLDEKSKTQFKPAASCLLALAYAVNGHYDQSESEFQSLVNQFEANPLSLEEIERDLKEFFDTNIYRLIEKGMKGYTSQFPKLNSALFFLNMAEYDYDEAQKYCKDALRLFKSKRGSYIEIFGKLVGEASSRKDYNHIIRYAQILEVLKDEPKD